MDQSGGERVKSVGAVGAGGDGPRGESTIGVLGGGQLGRMMGLAGLPLGLRFRFLEVDAGCPSADVGEVVVGAYDDPAALARLCEGLPRGGVVTYEFENVPSAAVRWLKEHRPDLHVYPPERPLAIAQDRVSEKTLFRALGIGTPEFAAVDDDRGLREAVGRIGLPSVLKTRRLGYDGKGQWVLRQAADVERAAAEMSGSRGGETWGLILEAWAPFVRELSVIGARSVRGEEVFYPVVQNVHREGVLRESIAPAPGLSEARRLEAESISRRVLDETGYVGVLAIELFEMADGALMANEMAPRVHNSGHWTMDGCEVGQFEMHLRAVLGWPLGGVAGVRARGACGMVNLLKGVPPAEVVLSVEGARLHVYGKKPKSGGELRKVGHVNVVAGHERELITRMERLKGVLGAWAG